MEGKVTAISLHLHLQLAKTVHGEEAAAAAAGAVKSLILCQFPFIYSFSLLPFHV